MSIRARRRRRNPTENEINWTPLLWGTAAVAVLGAVYVFYNYFKNAPAPTPSSNLGEEAATEIGGAVLGQSLAPGGENACYAGYGLLGDLAATVNTLLFNIPQSIGDALASVASGCSTSCAATRAPCCCCAEG